MGWDGWISMCYGLRGLEMKGEIKAEVMLTWHVSWEGWIPSTLTDINNSTFPTSK